MRSIAAAMLLLALPAAAHADLVPRSPPGTARLPGSFAVRVDPAQQAVGRDLRDARRAIDVRRERGELTRSEARRLRREARLIERLAERYARDGTSPDERRELELRTQTLGSSARAPRAR